MKVSITPLITDLLRLFCLDISFKLHLALKFADVRAVVKILAPKLVLYKTGKSGRIFNRLLQDKFVS